MSAKGYLPTGGMAAFPMLRTLPPMRGAHSPPDSARCAKQGSIVRDLYSLPVSVAAVASTLSARAPRPPGQQHV